MAPPHPPEHPSADAFTKSFETTDNAPAQIAVTEDRRITITTTTGVELQFDAQTWATIANYTAALLFARRAPARTPAAVDGAPGEAAADDLSLPLAARHLEGAVWVTIHDGALNHRTGRILRVTDAAFDATFAEVLVPGENPTMIRVGALTAAQAPTDADTEPA